MATNRFFNRAPHGALTDPDAFRAAIAQYFANKTVLVERLEGAGFLDLERLEATILWFGELDRFHEANDQTMSVHFFADFDTITSCLATQAQYSRTQRKECQTASARWQRFTKSVGHGLEGRGEKAEFGS